MQNDNNKKEELRNKLQTVIAEKKAARTPLRAFKHGNEIKEEENFDFMTSVTSMVDEYVNKNKESNPVRKKQQLKNKFLHLYVNFNPVWMAIANGNITTVEDIKGIQMAFEYGKKVRQENLSLEETRERVSQIVYDKYNHLLSDEVKKLQGMK